jgi:putative two-component system response regulator
MIPIELAAAGQDTLVAHEAHLIEPIRALRRWLEEGNHAPVDDRRELLRARSETGLPGSGVAPAGRVLVVDDDAGSRRVVAGILTDAGYDVLDVGSTWEARVALESEPIALLLTEVCMPRETGLDLIRFAMCEYPETATLLMSALEDPGVARAAMDFGAYGYLNKPVGQSAALIAVTSGLRRREAEARERAAHTELERAMTLRTSALAAALERLEEPAEESRVLQVETLHRWARAAEYHEEGIVRHISRVSRYCGVLGRALGLPHHQTLELASTLHDVGKAMVPDSILLKPGPLTFDERLAIETHADIGYELLRDSGTKVLDMAAVIAWTHHEKFDGSGYPRGLAATDIPLEGRIVAVADVFDALTCDRAYRQAWSVEATVAWMTRERGGHFDPAVVDALLASMDEILEVRGVLTTV